jgi:hypothetical protein
MRRRAFRGSSNGREIVNAGFRLLDQDLARPIRRRRLFLRCGRRSFLCGAMGAAGEDRSPGECRGPFRAHEGAAVGPQGHGQEMMDGHPEWTIGFEESTLAFWSRIDGSQAARAADRRFRVTPPRFGDFNSTQEGAWSLASGSPRTSRSTPAAFNRGATAGLRRRWSSLRPAAMQRRIRGISALMPIASGSLPSTCWARLDRQARDRLPGQGLRRPRARRPEGTRQGQGDDQRGIAGRLGGDLSRRTSSRRGGEIGPQHRRRLDRAPAGVLDY